MNTDVMFSKKSDNWATPLFMYSAYMDRGFFDPCPLNPKKDGLNIDWKKNTFVNPPYSDIKSWLIKAWLEFDLGHCDHIIFLVPSRTDTKWFHDLVYKKPNVDIEFLKGRLKFGDSKNSAPFPSMIINIKWENDKE